MCVLVDRLKAFISLNTYILIEKCIFWYFMDIGTVGPIILKV